MKVNDILVGTAGYDMTLAYFYQVVSVSATGKTVQLAELRQERKNPAPGAETALPLGIKESEKPIKRRVASDWRGDKCIYANDRLILRPWDGKPVRINTYD